MKTKILRGRGALLISVLILVSVFSLALSGCGYHNAYLGTWVATDAVSNGVTVDISEIFPDGLELEIEEEGRGCLRIEKKDSNIVWTEEDGVFNISDSSGTAMGWMEEDILRLSNVADSGVDFLLQRADK